MREDIRIIFSEHLSESRPRDRDRGEDYESWVEKARKNLKGPNKRNYCGYWEYRENDRETTYLLIPKKLCKLLNKSLCDSGNNCYNMCPVIRGDISDNIIRNYESFFEKFFQFILRKFWELSPYLFPITETRIPLKDSRPEIHPYISVSLLLACEGEIKEACCTILHSPYLTLSRETVFVPLSQARQVVPEVVTSILAHPQYFMEDPRGIFSNPDTQKRYSPYRVAQFRKKEGFNSYENRVVKFILHYFLYLLKQTSRTGVSHSKNLEIERPTELRRKAEEFAGWLEDFLCRTMWLETGLEFPSNLYSQVLLKRAGYRDLVRIYFLLQHTPIPSFFARLSPALELKRMDRLWEYYVLAVILDTFVSKGYRFNPVDFEEKEVVKEDRGSKKIDYYEHAKIELYGEGPDYRVILTFQKDDIQEGKLRPDFYLERKIGEETFKLVLDAKFKPSQNLHPCEVAKYVDPWEKEGEEKGLGDNCLAVTLEDGERISYDIVTFGFKKEREGIEHEYISDISERNKMVLGKVLDRFFLLERRGHHRKDKGCLGYVPLEIPKV